MVSFWYRLLPNIIAFFFYFKLLCLMDYPVEYDVRVVFFFTIIYFKPIPFFFIQTNILSIIYNPLHTSH